MAKNTGKEEKITKSSYIRNIVNNYEGLKGHFREVEKLRKNHKKRINAAYTSKKTAITNIVGTYKRGSRAGQLKINEKALNKLTLKELQRVNRLTELIEDTPMYSAFDADERKKAWDLAYTSFKNASSKRGSEKKPDKQREDLVRNRRFLKKKDYRELVYLFEKLEGDLLHMYGSEVAEQLYEETEAENRDADTLYEVLVKGAELANVAKSGGFTKDDKKHSQQLGVDFVWFWITEKADEPKSSLDKITSDFVRDKLGLPTDPDDEDYETDEEILDYLSEYE